MRRRPRRGGSGQTMVEFALATAGLVLLVMGLLEVALLGLADEGAQADVLEAARVASASVAAGNPVGTLEAGQSALLQLLPTAVFGTRVIIGCGGCGLPGSCVRYRDGVPIAFSARPCEPGPLPGGAAAGWGPAPAELDGPQNPRCVSGACFGVGAGMRGCRLPPAAGVVHVCLTYADWPATAVDVWVRGALLPLLPMPGLGTASPFLVDAHLRLQVEQLTA
ncbi:MAG TPA: hypothetical protein VMW47_02775 [Verrucomicrobiae bacterium]|nr:hypothetical protein [Verrucomicrobiae bacterium]